jgi:membrane peptidoglycan carboxypeptidase
VNLTNMTQAYGVFAAQGQLHPATTILEIRDRNNRLVYSLAHNAPEVTKPLTPSEAYLTHWILEGNTDPARNLLWGTRAILIDPNGVRRHAGFKTGTTDDFRDVSGFGYVPGSLVTGVWMGNNNQEPMSNVLGVGLFSADGPLYMWHDFMQRALNEPWDWNKQKPVPQTDFAKPADVQMVSVCRFSGMAATGNCGATQVMPFLPGTVPAPDNVHTRGCLDLVQYVRQSDPPRPDTWAQAAQIWSDRVVNGEYGARGDPKDYLSNASVRFTITPILGERLPSVCGVRRYVPPPPKKTPKGSPGPSAQPTPAPTKKPPHP